MKLTHLTSMAAIATISACTAIPNASNQPETAANKAIVTDLLDDMFVKGNIAVVDQYYADTLIQHNSDISDGLGAYGGFLQTMGEQGTPMKYNAVHQVIGVGNFVLALPDGAFGTDRNAFYDLFRLDDGPIVEHWGIVAQCPGPMRQTILPANSN